MRTRIPAICLGLLAGCYSPSQPDCGFLCGPNGECPDDYSCGSDRVCRRNGAPSSLACMVDAPPRPVDAPRDDVIPPFLVSTTPAAGETNVATGTNVVVQFSEAVVNVNTSTFLVVVASAVAGTVNPVSAVGAFQFMPASPLPPSSTITVTLTGGISDLAGNPLSPVQFTFETGT